MNGSAGCYIQKVSVAVLFILFFIALLFTPKSYGDDATDREQANFKKWLETVKLEARKKGISEKTITAALGNVKLLKPVILKDNNQPEIKQSYKEYLTARVSTWRIEKGQAMMHENQALLSKIAKQYAVQPQFIAAIWGMETNYGTYELTIPVFDAIATLAYHPRRAQRFRRELFASLKIIENGEATVDMMKGSWAGAMGQPQFMPETYLVYAKDHDGDGLRDIWKNNGDIFASIAAYLKHFQWDNTQTWGKEVKIQEGQENALFSNMAGGVIPDKICKKYTSLGVWRPLKDWNDLGISNMNGTRLPTKDIAAALIIGDKGDNHGYLVYRNFCSIMKYNPSFKYALGVSMLADKIKGGVR